MLNPGGWQNTILIAVSKVGAEQAVRLARAWPGVVLVLPERWASLGQGLPVRIFSCPLSEETAEIFPRYGKIVFFLAVGAVVRLIAPHLDSKITDPSVVVVAGGYAISLLSGHIGGANQLARAVAVILEVTPVITTASESLGLPAVDLLGQELGWRIEATSEALRRAAACLVNGDPVALIQETGSRAWWQGSLPEILQCFDCLENIPLDRFSALLWITHRPADRLSSFAGPMVIYRPPLILGFGCDRGATGVEAAVAECLERLDIAPGAIHAVATVDRKADEPGLLAILARYGWPLRLFSAGQLAQVQVPNPSATVLRHLGTPSVAEAAALSALAPENRVLFLEKTVFRGPDGRHITLALAKEAP